MTLPSQEHRRIAQLLTEFEALHRELVAEQRRVKSLEHENSTLRRELGRKAHRAVSRVLRAMGRG
jgi:predicted nuclease with TOPRIM domain